eukprot:10352511-Alexandrium_andersonii.AAC.1
MVEATISVPTLHARALQVQQPSARCSAPWRDRRRIAGFEASPRAPASKEGACNRRNAQEAMQHE